MADLLRHPAERGLPLLIALLAACGAPISNAPFTEEGAFLDALLAQDDLAAPEALLAVSADGGTAPLLVQARLALDAYEGLLAFPVAVCGQLAEVGPTQRTAVRRIWSPTALTVPVATDADGGQRLETIWVQAEVLRVDEARFEVRVDARETETVSAFTIATGFVDDGASVWRWELDRVATVLDLDVGRLATLELAHEPAGGADGGRRVEARYGTPPTFDASWVLDGDAAFAFSGRFAVTTDGLTWPGYLTVVHTVDGGRGLGEVDVAGETLSFGSCWEGDGTGIWQGGEDPRIATAGDPAACPDP